MAKIASLERFQAQPKWEISGGMTGNKEMNAR